MFRHPWLSASSRSSAGAYRVAGDVDGWAEVSGKFRHDARATADFPAVGDWVCVTPTVDPNVRSSRAASIAAAQSPARPPAAPSKSSCRRERRHDLLVTALAEDLNPRRSSATSPSSATRARLPWSCSTRQTSARSGIGRQPNVRARLPFVDVLAISAKQGDGLGALDAYLSPAQTVALIGRQESGSRRSSIDCWARSA
jgi:ribosome biogenesis GTPase